MEMPVLSTLLLKNNKIRSVSDDIIVGLANLTKFDLRDNFFEQKPEHWKGLDYILIGKSEIFKEVNTNSGHDDERLMLHEKLGD